MRKDILTLLDLDKEDFDRLFNLASELKRKHKNNIAYRPFEGKTLGLIFDKPSTRTRLSFEAAMIQLGGASIFINVKDTQLSRNEPVKDTAIVISRYLDVLAIRTHSQNLLEEFAKFASIPVINALTDLYHPCQVLSDIFTIVEHKKSYKNLKIAWIGDGNNVSHSWINASAVLGLNLVLACPNGYFPNSAIMEKATKIGNGKIILTENPLEAVKDADVIYTDVWTSMGEEEKSNIRRQAFKDFQVNEELLKEASKDVIVMHCLPAHRGEEISENVLEGRHSVVWEQAENKLHITKAVLVELILGVVRSEN